MIRNPFIPLIFCTALMACGPGAGEIGARLDDIDTELLAQTEVLCECYAEFGHASREACEAEFTSLDPGIRACLVDAFAVDGSASVAYLDCILSVEEEFTDCSTMSLQCADPASLDACDQAYDAALDACPAVPLDVNAALENCFPQPAS